MSLQIISRFFYYSQIPRCITSCSLTLPKVRLHLFNHDYFVIFDIFQGTKLKRKIKNESIPHLWNCQSLEVAGKIYITGGSLANTKTYLNTAYVLNENTWMLDSLAPMQYQRDAHGIIEWKRQFMIVIGSWHVEANSKTCEMYDIKKNEWTTLPELNFQTCAPGLIIFKGKFLLWLILSRPDSLQGGRHQQHQEDRVPGSDQPHAMDHTQHDQPDGQEAVNQQVHAASTLGLEQKEGR